MNASGTRFFQSGSDTYQPSAIFWRLLVDERQEGMPDLGKIRVVKDSVFPVFLEEEASRFLNYGFSFNLEALGVEDALDTQLRPNGTSSRIVWDFILYSTNGEVVQKIPFMMLYDATFVL